jgi:FAD-linked oxidoreductase
MQTQWRNWSGSVDARPTLVAHPATEDELRELVQRATHVRITGAGHSFMPLCDTDGALIALDRFAGEIAVAPDRRSVWAPAGWSLRKLTRALWDLDLSLPNQGDVDPQSLAGAISTGTHGTGAELGSLSTFARAFRLMLADGSIVDCSAERQQPLFEAQRLSLGLLGIVLGIRVDVVPAMRLEEHISLVPLDEVADRFAELAAQHRHVEFFVFPYADAVILKTLHPTADERAFEAPHDSDERIFEFACDLAASIPFVTRTAQRLMMRFIRPTRRVGPAHLIFPSERNVRFEEMEYELPRDAGFPTLREAIHWIRRRRLPVTFPFEFRWVAGDDIWLSPFNRGPTASISTHQYSKMPWQALFAEAEPMFRAAGGRPHWAKRHTLTAQDVDAMYPRAGDFRAVRADVDPHGKFTNAHLAQLFR